MTEETAAPASSIPIDAARLARAIHLDVERRGDNAWTVSGGSQLHVVRADASECDCSDHAMRGGPCKHALAVRLRLGDLETVRALRTLVSPAGHVPRRHTRERGATT